MLERLLNGYVFQVITYSAEERTAGGGQNKAFDTLLSGASLKRLEYCGMFAVDRENRHALFFGAGRYKLAAGDKALLLINGSGATTTMEMLICYRKAKQMLEAMGVTVLPGKCDELLTVQEMAGFQMILCKCCDTCAQYLAAPANAPYWTTR